MTEEEFNFFKRQMHKAKQKTQTDFFLAVLRKKPIIVIENLNETLAELKRHGNNLNQIARELNKYGLLDDEFEKVINDCWNAYNVLISTCGGA